MTNFNYYNPVKIHFGAACRYKLRDLILDRSALLLTTKYFLSKNIYSLLDIPKEKLAIMNHPIAPNPDLDNLEYIYSQVRKSECEVIIALGGGSVIDTVKACAAYSPSKSFESIQKLIKGHSKAQDFSSLPYIAIPTTSGTGSEVTTWGTIWDFKDQKKYSLNLPTLWAEHCLSDPELLLSLPKNITKITVLDALSHSLEAIWNTNANPISTTLAIRAAKGILGALPLALADPDDMEARHQLMLSSLQAGLAFSNTETSLAHALSYYLTLEHGVPHGIASSFSLPAIADAVSGQSRNADAALKEIFGNSPGTKLRELYAEISVSDDYRSFGVAASEIKAWKSDTATSPRYKNSLVSIDQIFKRLTA